MPGNASMTIFIGADNKDFIKKMDATQRALKRGLGREAMSASEGAATGLSLIAAAMGALGLASVKMAGDMQANKRAFASLLGDTQKAEQFLNDLAKFAADTPFELPGLVDASKKLLAFRFAAADIIPIMTIVGDAIGMLGGGQEGIDRVTRALGQIQAKGKVSAEEINQLAEAGIGAWKYLADAIGVSTAQAMKMAEQGMIDGTTGINAILLGMQKDFKGGMMGLSQEIPGLWSTITDNATASAREMGDKIIAALDIKARMRSLADSLGQFADYVKNSGINKALQDMVPKSLTLAIFAISGALIGAAIPAMVAFAVSIWQAIVPLAPFIAAGAALGATAWVIWQAWEPLGNLFSQTWTAAVATTQAAWANLISIVLSGVQTVLGGLGKLVGFFNSDWGAVVSGWANNMQGAIDEAGAQADIAAVRMEIAGNGIAAAWDNTKTAVVGGANAIVDAAKSVTKAFTGLTGNGIPAGAPDSKAEKAWESLSKKAKQVSKSIEEQWVQTTKTELEQLEAWRTQQMADLDKTKAANENYQRDVTRLEATYSARRKKIFEEEAQKRNNIWDQAADTARSLQNKIGSIGLSGVRKEKFDIESSAVAEIESVERKYRDLAATFKSANTGQQEAFKQSWVENGILFKQTAEGMVDFSRQKAAEITAIEDEKNQKIKDLRFEQQKWEDDLALARKDGNIAAFAAQLNSEQALLSQDLAGRQDMIDVHYRIWQDSHRTAMSYMAEGISGMYRGMQTFFADAFSGTKSLSDAWKALGQAVIQVIASMAAQWVASRIMMGLFGDSFTEAEIAKNTAVFAQRTAAATASYAAETAAATASFSAKTAAATASYAAIGAAAITAITTMTAASVAAGAAIAAAWAPAAAMVSLASFGANSAPAIAGITATTATAVSMSVIPALATGGITTGPTLAEIGEGHKREAVLPLDRKVFERMGLTNKEQPRQTESRPLIIQAFDSRSFERWLETSGGRKLKRYLAGEVRRFAPAEV